MSDLPVFILISSAFVLVPVIISHLSVGKREPAFLRRLRILLWVMVAIEGTTLVLREMGVQNNMPLYHFYVLIEFALTAWMFEASVPRILTKRTFYVLLAGMALIAVFTHLKSASIYDFPSVMRSVESLLLMGLSIRFFWVMMHSDEERNLLGLPEFWASVGLLIYFSSNLMLFFYGNYMASQSAEVFDALWHLHAGLNILLYLVYTIAFICLNPIKK